MKNKNRLKFYLKIIIVTFIFIFLTPLIINIIVTFENPFGLGFIYESNKDTWINFFGAIIGGGATLLGVWWTIKDQENKRKQDLAIQYKPYLNVNKELANYENMYYRDLQFMISYQGNSSNPEPEYILFNQAHKDAVKYIYSLKNFGRGNVYNASIEDYTIKNPEYFDMHLMSSKYVGYIGEIIPEQEIALVLYFPPLLRLKNEYLNQKEVFTTLNCIIKYTDEFEVNAYELNIYFTLKIEIHKTNYSSGVNDVSVIAPVYCITSCMPSLKDINKNNS